MLLKLRWFAWDNTCMMNYFLPSELELAMHVAERCDDRGQRPCLYAKGNKGKATILYNFANRLQNKDRKAA